MSWLSCDLLKPLNGLRRPQNPFGSLCSDLGSIRVLRILEQGIKLSNEQILSSTQVVSECHPEGQILIRQIIDNVRNYSVFVDCDRQDLSLSIDSKNPTRGFMSSSNKNSVRANSVHVYTRSTLQVVEMNVSVLCDQIDNVVLVTCLNKTSQ